MSDVESSIPANESLVSELRFRLHSSWRHNWRWLSDRVSDGQFDKRFGIASSQRRSLEQLGLKMPGRFDYQPASYRDLKELFESIPIEEADVFLDFGSGMGRALCFAMLYPFRRIIGVELSPELCAVARENVRVFKGARRCRDIQVINADAVDYTIPSDVSVIYFFNPFGGSILPKVLMNIATSLRDAPRQIRIVFCGTASAQTFRNEAKRCPWLAPVSERVLGTGTIGLFYTNSHWNAPERKSAAVTRALQAKASEKLRNSSTTEPN